MPRPFETLDVQLRALYRFRTNITAAKMAGGLGVL